MASATYTDKSRSDAERRIRDEAGGFADKAADFASSASKRIDDVIEGAEATARRVADTGRDAGERVSEVAGHMKGAIDKSVREQPMTTLAVAAALGFVIGALWKS